ncbi:hypothetical protein AB0M54_39775 [Actinoplanes sp. NPDC051470]|uniref:hypothetical protein n=1 Tax=Actinoplanes sp. NPDC051470 TaxID=3157224 RepID=UPI0034316EF6
MNNTDELFGHLRKSFDQVHLEESADRIVARGQSLRRRRAGVRVAMTALGAAAVTAALAVSLPQEATHRPEAAPGQSASSSSQTHVHLAAWSVDSGPLDTVTLTLRTASDPARLTKALAEAGVPAKVEFFEPGQQADCIGAEASLPQLAQVVDYQPKRTPSGATVMTIKRDAMPSGSVLHFAIFKSVMDGMNASASTVWLLHGDANACVLTTTPKGGPTPAPRSS